MCALHRPQGPPRATSLFVSSLPPLVPRIPHTLSSSHGALAWDASGTRGPRGASYERRSPEWADSTVGIYPPGALDIA